VRLSDVENQAHIPVLADEVIEIIRPRAGGLYLDATVGAGGHSRRLLDASAPDGRVIAYDRDERALAEARRALSGYGERISFIHDDFRNAPSHLDPGSLDGLVADLGVSSIQLEDPEAGFSFRLSGPLDMRMDQRSGQTAADLLNTLSRKELAELLRRFGDERRAARISKAIVAARADRRIERTDELAAIVRSAFSERERRTARIDPATRTFQALRIAVNDELRGLDEFLASAAGLLRPGARMAVISFHSLEDGIVKRTLRGLSGGLPRSRHLPPEAEKPSLRLVTRRVLRPSEGEVESNPRSRSARLRAAEKLEGE
jgi:16S rRNA (cytosine1402-N4)-methyltransferase